MGLRLANNSNDVFFMRNPGMLICVEFEDRFGYTSFNDLIKNGNTVVNYNKKNDDL